MLTYKTSEDFEKMARAGKVVSNIHYEIYNLTKPGMTLRDLDDIAKNIVEKSNVQSSFFGYAPPGHDPFPAYICASPNDAIVHGIPNGTTIQEGDLISIDVGVSFEGFHADAAFTYGVGEISSEDKFLIDTTKHALNEALKLEDKYIVTSISKKLKNPSVKYSYPLIENYIPQKFKNSLSTLALIHAISHQESNFRINAYSSAGARGVMQLMPYTAKKVAKDLKIRYRKKELTRNPQYNVTLGSTYIYEMLKRYKNSLPLALASYNAGPNRVKIWLKRYGDPRKGQISFIDWIESIPLEETRYYVKKVLANLRVYQKKYKIELYEARQNNDKNFAMTYWHNVKMTLY